MNKTTKQHPIALNLPRVVALLIVYGRHVVQKMTDNTWFPSPDPDLATVTEHLDALLVSEATARGRGEGTAAARDLDWKTVVDDMLGLKAYVGKVVSQNPGQAVAIIESAGMSRKRYTKYQKPALAAVLAPYPGEIRVKAKAVRKGAAYDWQYSTDDGQTWIGLGTTTVANTSLQGVTAGTTYLFRFRTTRSRTTSDWSPTVSLSVH